MTRFRARLVFVKAQCKCATVLYCIALLLVDNNYEDKVRFQRRITLVKSIKTHVRFLIHVQ